MQCRAGSRLLLQHMLHLKSPYVQHCAAARGATRATTTPHARRLPLCGSVVAGSVEVEGFIRLQGVYIVDAEEL